MEKTSQTRNGDEFIEREFQTLNEAYRWVLEDAQISLPFEQRNLYEIGNWEVCSYEFIRDILELNVRREGFDFGVPGVSNRYCDYTFYYVDRSRIVQSMDGMF